MRLSVTAGAIFHILLASGQETALRLSGPLPDVASTDAVNEVAKSLIIFCAGDRFVPGGSLDRARGGVARD